MNNRQTMTARVAELFRGYPNTWISSDRLMLIGGRCAWRTRVSNCREQFNMNIENRVRLVRSANGERYKISEYRYVPAVKVTPRSRPVQEKLFAG